MTQLVPMNERDFQNYLTYAIEEYAQEHVKSGNWQADEALSKAQGQYQEILPEGLASKDNYFFSIEDEESGRRVGMLWFAVMRKQIEPRAFVFDIKIEEEFRRRGYGQQAFQLLEAKVRALGLDTIGLHVFGHNHAARELYTKLGYIETNIQMSKKLVSI